MIRAETIVGDVSALPDHNVGPGSLGWWGAIGLMLIQGMGLVLMIGMYCYLLPRERAGLTSPEPPPLPWGSLLTGLALASELPNAWIKQRARRCDPRATQFGLSLITVTGVALVVLRMLELASLDARWHTTAHGSTVWALLVLHTTYLAADVVGWGVLAALSFRTEMTGRRFSAIAQNVLHWHFIVWSWVALYVVIYWLPRWL